MLWKKQKYSRENQHYLTWAEAERGTSLSIQLWRPCALNARCPGSIPSWGTKILTHGHSQFFLKSTKNNWRSLSLSHTHTHTPPVHSHYKTSLPTILFDATRHLWERYLVSYIHQFRTPLSPLPGDAGWQLCINWIHDPEHNITSRWYHTNIMRTFS